MPPTIQSGRRDDNDRKARAAEKRSELLCRVKYNNTLPDIPFDPKFITYPFEANRYVQYNPTSLERAYKHELQTEHDLGITIDLINPSTYSIDPSVPLHEDDEKLLEEDTSAGTPQDTKRSKQHHANVSWLRKTMYISSEYNKFQTIPGKAESQVGFNLKKKFNDEYIYKDHDSQIIAIQQTFDDAKIEITSHYSKPDITPIEVLPILPDFELWRHPCAQVIFDSDPANKEKSGPAQVDEMSQAMIRGMVDESGDQFVAYFLPTDETLSKRKSEAEEGIDYKPEEEYDYMMSREYNWSVKNKFSKSYEESYFFVSKDNGCFYNEIETRVRLSKRRKIGTDSGPTAKTRLIVKHRELSEQEVAAQDARLTMLEPPAEEEEEEPEEQAAAEEEAEESDKEDKKSDRSRSRSRSRSKSGSRSRSSSSSSSASDKESGSEKGSSSESEAESGDEEAKKDAEEIFGSGSSDSD